MSAVAPVTRWCRGCAWLVALALTFGGQACYRPNQPDCAIACGAGGLCPRGMRCSNGLCARGSAQCPGGPDAATDAELLDSDLRQDVPPADVPAVATGPMADTGVEPAADVLADAPIAATDAASDRAPHLPPDAGLEDGAENTLVLTAAQFGVMQDRNDPNTIELYGVNTFGSLVRRGGPGSSGIADIDFGAPAGVRLAGTPSAISWEKGRVDIFTRGLDKQLHQKRLENGVWQNWSLIWGLDLGSDPAVVTRGIQRLDLFARGAKVGDLWHFRYDHGWSVRRWENLGGLINSTPAVVALAEERIDVFARNPADVLVHLAYDGTWLEWESLGDTLLLGPAVTSRKPGVIEVYGVRSNQRLEYFEWKPTGRGQWQPLELDMPGDFRVVTLAPRRVLVLSRSEGVAWQRFIDFSD